MKKRIEKLFHFVRRSLCTITGDQITFDRTIEALTVLAQLVDDWDTEKHGDNSEIWSIGECYEFTLDNLLIGAYWWASNYHSGQSSPEYRMLSAIGNFYSPGMSSLDDDSSEREAYDCLRVKYHENTDKPQRMRSVTVHFDDERDNLTTSINGTRDDIIQHYKRPINVGSFDETAPNEGDRFELPVAISFHCTEDNEPDYTIYHDYRFCDFVYNDEFDSENYPIQEWQRVEIRKVCEIVNRVRRSKITYFATIHGAIFKIDHNDSGRPGCKTQRFDADDLQTIAQLTGFRWFESANEYVQIGLTHQKPQN